MKSRWTFSIPPGAARGNEAPAEGALGRIVLVRARSILTMLRYSAGERLPARRQLDPLDARPCWALSSDTDTERQAKDVGAVGTVSNADASSGGCDPRLRRLRRRSYLMRTVDLGRHEAIRWRYPK